MTFHFAVANHAESTSAIGEGRAPRVRLVQEWLGQRLDTLPRVGSGEEYRLLPHCTEHTTALSAVRDWQSVFSAFGFTLKVLPLGCRRMAGTWGHEAERIYALSWARHVADAGGGGWLVADGYSCRSQVKIIDGTRLAHPVQALLAGLRATGASVGRPKGGQGEPGQERAA
jgi:Fe-S oxidoreductase